MPDETTARELNRLYWESDLSVSDIADRLDISRRALYDGIEPLPAGRPCPECGTELVFRNRTAAENREAECPECGHETTLENGDERSSRPMASAPAGEEPLRRRSVPAPGTGPVLGTAFLTGLVVGALATSLFHRR
ncbi:MAG: hypothetical protein R3314_04900 [Longimicrobiales bacterium]|nr:hypothetical protein [Longimicrobiales bacterium]